MKMHHTHTKFLAARNLKVVETESGVALASSNTNIGEQSDVKALVAAIGAWEKETGKQAGPARLAGFSGVMVKTFHEVYTKNGGGCADLLDRTLRDELTTKVGKDFVCDVERLKKMAMLHGVWNPRYDSLNPGMARMNVSNRLRSLIRKGAVMDIFGTEIGPNDLRR